MDPVDDPSSALSDRRAALRSRARQAVASVARCLRVAEELYDCPCCGYLTLTGPRIEICPICHWSDDGQDDDTASIVRGGSNQDLSLDDARANVRRYLVKYPSDDRRVPAEIELIPKKKEIIAEFDFALNAKSDGEAVEALCRATEAISGLIAVRDVVYDRSVEPW